MNVIGISGFFHDSAATILKNGEIIAAAQEERFSRLKNDASFPLHAINYCLEEARIEDDEIDCVAFYENPTLTLDRIAHEILHQSPEVALQQYRTLVQKWSLSKLDIKAAIETALPNYKQKILLIDHHQSHAASAFYPSPFENAAILTIDGVGEWSTATISFGSSTGISRICQMRYPHSVGLFYSAATNFLGYKVNSGEYKVMGLAAYGDPIYEGLLRDNVVQVNNDGSILLNLEYFDFSGTGDIATSKWEHLFKIAKRKRETAILDVHADIAASIQKISEEILLKMSVEAKKLTESPNLCMAGGVALNCVANKRIFDETIFERIWIQPAAGDSGGSLGAALAAHHEFFEKPRKRIFPDGMKGCLLGPAYSDDEIKDFLEIYGFPFEELQGASIAKEIALMVSSGSVVGLYQGHMEFGPRALGARSIIADPRTAEMRSVLNKSIKFREAFRPFAPAVLEKEAANWFDLTFPSPYMLFVAPVSSDKRNPRTGQLRDINERLAEERSQISAVTHVDFTARVQTLSTEAPSMMKNIVEEFFKITGVPLVINTSFNLRGEPIVCTPADAYRCMMRSQMDAILMGKYLVRREQQPPWPEDAADNRILD